MNAHISITISLAGMLAGFGLLFLASWRKAADQHESKLWRMFLLLAGCVLVSMPFVVGAWMTLSGGGYLFKICAVSAIFVGSYSPCLVLLIIKWVRGDAKQFLK